MMSFSRRLLDWYSKNRRPLPWRDTTSPYHIWLSEIILQQTRVEQGIGYYLRFVEAFPDINSLSAATEEQILLLWQGLGYYTRARNLHAAAKEITQNRRDAFPQTSNEWIKIRGVGPYTAAAIASIAFREPVPAIDGNVYRIFSRLLAVEESIDSQKGKRIIHDIAVKLIDRNDPGAFNQALMDFGSLVCKPVNPDCQRCIFNNECHAYALKTVSDYPRRKQKKANRKRFFNYFFIYFQTLDGNPRFCIQQRKNEDIWKHLHEWPLIETQKAVEESTELLSTGFLKDCFPGGNGFTLMGAPLRMRHQLTHQSIFAVIYIIRAEPSFEKKIKKYFRLVQRDEFDELAKPRLIENACQKINAFLNSATSI